MSRLPFLLLGLLASALSAGILLQFDPAGETDADLPQAAPRRAPPATSPVQAAGVPGRAAEWAATVLARPLFSPDRRPPAPSGAVSAAGAVLPRLAGTLVTPEGRSAIFAGGPTPLVVQEGGLVGDFTVMRIEPGQVTLTGPEGAQTVIPRFDLNRPAAPAAARLPSQATGAQAAGQAAGQRSRPGPAPSGLDAPGALPPVPGPPIPGSPPAAGSFLSALGAAEEAVPFEQNATPSGLDILRNMNRNAETAAFGAGR
ncbi:hypothetical protein ACFQX4_25935 [Roseomonas sp. GCM10028921]